MKKWNPPSRTSQGLLAGGAWVALVPVGCVPTATGTPTGDPAAAKADGPAQASPWTGSHDSDPLVHLEVLSSAEMAGRDSSLCGDGFFAATSYVVAFVERHGLVGPNAQSPYLYPVYDCGQGEMPIANTMALLRGQGPQSDEIVVAMAHLDHLGYPCSTCELHPGANDNASGVAALLATIPELVLRERNRSILFLWTAEEEELGIGASKYIENPLLNLGLDDTVAIVNLDMVGRLDANQLSVLDPGEDHRFRAFSNEPTRDSPPPS